MKTIKIYYTSLIFLSIFTLLNAQDLKDYLYATPEVKAMTRYGDYPVGYNTGVPEINIPVYTINSGSIKLPISMKFHPSGRKVEEKEGIFGYGWTLDCGGIITRTKRGFPDENNRFPFTPKDFLNDNYYSKNEYNQIISTQNYDFNFLAGITQNPRHSNDYTSTYYDNQYDIFTYVLPNSTGHFILKDTVINGDPTRIPMLIPYDALDIKVEYSNSNNITQISNFTITDKDGVEYFFNSQETSDNWTYDDLDLGHSLDISENSTTWLLNAITSADKVDAIVLNYVSGKKNGWYKGELNAKCSSQSLSISDQLISGTGYMDPYYSHVSFNDNISGKTQETFNYGQTLRLSSVSYRNGSIIFSINSSTKMADLITIKDITGKIIQQNNFTYSKYPNESVYTLDKMKISGSDGIANSSYLFDYYRGSSSDYLNWSLAKDWWGYYNGARNYTLIPNFKVGIMRYGEYAPNYQIVSGSWTNSDYPAHRNVNEYKCKIGMIKSITYPTGGKTTFDYESNKYTSNGVQFDGPGLRVKDIYSYPNTPEGKVTHKSYTYEMDDFPQEFQPYKNVNGQSYLPVDENFLIESRARMYISQPHFFTSTENNEEMVYLNAKGEEIYNTSKEDVSFIIKTIWSSEQYTNLGAFLDYMDYRFRNYNSDFVLETSGLNSSNVFYGKVTETVDIDNTNNFKTIYYFSPLNRKTSTYKYYAGKPTWRPIVSEYTIENRRKFMEDELSWKGGKLVEKDEYIAGSTTPVKRTGYYYTDIIRDSAKEILATQCFNFIDNTTLSWHETQVRDIIKTTSDNIFAYALKKYSSGIELLTQTVEITDNVEKTTVYTYEPEYLMLDSLITYDSKSVRYWDGDLDKMIDNKSNVVTKFTYPFQYNESPYIEMKQKNILSPVVEQIDSRNNNNFLQKTRTNYFKWSDNLFAPISIQKQTKNQTNYETRILFTNYDKYANPLSVSKDDATKIVYIWSYMGQYPVAEIKNANYEQIKNTLGETYLSTLSDNKNPTQQDLLKLNELRTSTALPNVMVKTYTYYPLIGIKTQTDERGVSIYYEYDTMGRLKTVFDNNMKIIKTYDYHVVNNN